MGRAIVLICLLLVAAGAQASLKVTVVPAKKSVRENIEAYVGVVEGDSPQALERQFRHIDQQATLAA